ncbi:WecB/TagA/CpsF family glycosyltransferase [Rhodoligotrophos ferricapiens]|uniref:WecB/TagA/CpsF family glycosyltransferase n=1 Tax=Rhodoligotrophos ferricapiens TaxID=3069264 RepID=UPI00315D951B
MQEKALAQGRNWKASAVDAIPFLGVQVSNLGVPEAARLIADRPENAPFAYVVTPNAQHFVRLGRLRDSRFREAYAHAWLRLCDSQVARKLARPMFGLSLPYAAGSDLTAYLFAHVIRPEDAITVIGGSDELHERLTNRFGLKRLLLHVPPMGFIDNPDAVEAAIQFVIGHPARYVFIAVGSPRSEYLARMIAERPGATGTGMCIGNSLNFVTDISRRAPEIYRKLGIEWLHRLALNPRGHARRVFVESAPLLAMMAHAWLKPGAYDPPLGAQSSGACS